MGSDPIYSLSRITARFDNHQMLDKEIARLARDQIRLEIAEQNAQLRAEIGRIRAEMSARGVLHSGMTLHKVAQACADAARDRGQLTWKTLSRFVTTAGVLYDEELGDDLKAVVDEFLPPTLEDLKGYPKQEAEYLNNQNAVAELERMVEDARSSILAKTKNEIDLFTISLKTRPAVAPERSEMADRDSLTKLFTRGMFDNRFAKDLAEAAKSKRPLSLIFMDIDRFKAINDAYGHQVGDAVLVGAAQCIEGVAAGKGSTYRYGGEEIVIVLPNHDVQETIAVAERARRCLESTRLNDLAVTASFGVSTFPEHGRFAKEIIEAADKAMYDAKDRGRNLVCVFGEPAPQSTKGREPERKAPTPGVLTEKQRNELRETYFRGGTIRCPRDGAILTVSESTPVAPVPITTLLVMCKMCGLVERI
jgi:diguanylate cyclase (GGDEF)-like protein